MSTAPGGEEQNQYESAITENVPSSKSGGQLGQAATTENPSKTADAAQQQSERGEKTAENIRYGQTISEGGMGGMTSTQSGGAAEEGYGRVSEQAGEEGSAAGQRVVGGYGGERDQDRGIGG